MKLVGRRLGWFWAFTFALAVGATAAPAILPLSEVKPGMKGYGKTVFEGLEIAKFDFEVVDVLETDGFATNLILVKVGGKRIDKVGGIAAGMSGSPLYIDDKMVGAVAFTTPFSDTHYGYATPIEDMLKVFDLNPPTLDVAALPTIAGLPAGTPLLVGGLRGRAFDAVSRWLSRHGLRAVPTSRTQAEPQLAPAPSEEPTVAGVMLPGSSVAASLTTGDVVLTALGTVTWRDGDRLLAFGHPFMQRGATSLFMHPAYVYGVIPAQDLAFKVGAPSGPPVGAFIQDRAAGLGGLLQAKAKSFGLQVTVKDETLNRERTYNSEVVLDRDLAPTLAAVSLLQALDEVMDRLGAGSAQLDWEVNADGLTEPLKGHDRVYSSSDVTAELVPGPLFALDALLRNDFAEVTPTRVKINAVTSAARRTVRILGVRCEPAEPRAGTTAKVIVRLQPYRGQATSQTLEIAIPAGAQGRLVLDVHGRMEGVFSPLSQAALMAGGLDAPASLPELVNALAQAPRGDTLTAELVTPEADAERSQLTERLRNLPAPDLFSEEPQSLPTVTADNDLSTRPLARVAATLAQVVQGRWRQSLTVAAP